MKNSIQESSAKFRTEKRWRNEIWRRQKWRTDKPFVMSSTQMERMCVWFGWKSTKSDTRCPIDPIVLGETTYTWTYMNACACGVLMAGKNEPLIIYLKKKKGQRNNWKHAFAHEAHEHAHFALEIDPLLCEDDLIKVLHILGTGGGGCSIGIMITWLNPPANASKAPSYSLSHWHSDSWLAVTCKSMQPTKFSLQRTNMDTEDKGMLRMKAQS